MILDGRRLGSTSAELVSFRELRMLGITQRLNDLYL